MTAYRSLRMITTHILPLAIALALLATIYQYRLLPAPATNTMSASAWHFKAQHGFFSHDDDPERWDFRATTLPSLGLLSRSYPTDDISRTSENKQDASTQWTRFLRYVQHLNQEDPANKRYKLFYIVRHGKGLHNVKETEVGREEWNVSLSPPPTRPLFFNRILALLGQAARRRRDYMARCRAYFQR
jgi:hypothetical protein